MIFKKRLIPGDEIGVNGEAENAEAVVSEAEEAVEAAAAEPEAVETEAVETEAEAAVESFEAEAEAAEAAAAETVAAAEVAAEAEAETERIQVLEPAYAGMEGASRSPLRRRRKMSYERKKGLYGYGFIGIWIIGVLTFFIRPLIGVFEFAFCNININQQVGGYTLSWNNFKWIKFAFQTDPSFLRSMVTSFLSMFYSVPGIVIFSLTIAVILNQNFRGRTFARAVFFLPVIVTSGVVISIIQGDSMSTVVLSGSKGGSMVQAFGLSNFLYSLNLNADIVNFISNFTNQMFNFAWKSGVQILLFIAALQTISPDLYEASSIEGATGWEDFWKITIPMISPMILLASIYTIVDSFTDYSSSTMTYITDQVKNNGRIEYGSVLAIIYSLLALLVIGIVYVVIDRMVFYSVD
ncbi:MAG: sugar ABC transporter permease [Clostridia bacterium]|nr:sugar ABC transporter permease [Clostridia bacterium]